MLDIELDMDSTASVSLLSIGNLRVRTKGAELKSALQKKK